MHPLPAVAAAGRWWVLPMADASAAALAELLLSGDAAGAAERLNEILPGDPPLAIWGVWLAHKRDGYVPATTAQLADWLARHRFEVLQWDRPRASRASIRPLSPASWTEQSAALAQRVERNIALSLLAAGLAAANGYEVAGLAPTATAGEHETAERARLAGLCYDALGWLTQANQSDKSQSQALVAVLPELLLGPATGSSGDAAWAFVRRAEQLLADARQQFPSHDQAALSSRASEQLLADDKQPPAAVIDPSGCRHQAEQAARRWAARVGGLADWLAVLAARLARLEQLETRFAECLQREKLDAMAEFAAGAGHEINNPLTVIAGRARLFLGEETDPERRRALALISAQAMRVYEMIADMRLFARPPRPEPRSFDLQELLGRLVAEFAEQAAQQAIRFVRAGLSEPLLIEADPVQLHVALSAICRNALEAIGAEGHVELYLGADASTIQIRVSDDGPGISAEERRHLFDPFYSARQAGRGLGLGLSKAWRIVQNHAGRIDVESEPGHGARFTITLPRRFAGLASE